MKHYFLAMVDETLASNPLFARRAVAENVWRPMIEVGWTNITSKAGNKDVHLK